MELIKFSQQRGATKINADDLDANFAALRPLQQAGGGLDRQYAVNETPHGWQLKLFPNLKLVEVERCDGRRMQVLGTDWY
jgi:hypothetical protein